MLFLMNATLIFLSNRPTRAFIHDSMCPEGIVHPKIKIMSSFTHPHVVPKLYDFLYSVERKENILNNVVN